MHFMGKLGLEKVLKGPGKTLTIKKHFLTFTLSVKKVIIILSVFNVQIIRLCSLGSWNFYVPNNCKI